MRFKDLVMISCFAFLGCDDKADTKDPSEKLNGKKVSELQGAELLDLCTWALAQLDTGGSNEQLCTAAAAEHADSKAECEEERDLCLEDAEEWEDEDEDEDESCDTFSLDKACDIAVSQFKSCFSALMRSYAKVAEEASCDDLSVGTISAPSACDGVPQACVAFEASSSSVSSSGLMRR